MVSAFKRRERCGGEGESALDCSFFLCAPRRTSLTLPLSSVGGPQRPRAKYLIDAFPRKLGDQLRSRCQPLYVLPETLPVVALRVIASERIGYCPRFRLVTVYHFKMQPKEIHLK